MNCISRRGKIRLPVFFVFMFSLATVAIFAGINSRQNTDLTDNAVCLKTDYQRQWLSYSISEALLQLELPPGTRLYLAGAKTSKTLVAKLPENKLWLSKRFEDSLGYAPDSFDYWTPLTPLPGQSSIFSKYLLLFSKYAGSEFYADLGQGKWLRFAFPDDDVIPIAGLIRTELRQAVHQGKRFVL